MKKRTYKIISFAALLFLVSACDEFLNVNVNPNSTTGPPAKTILAGATTEIAFHMGSDIHRFSSEWVQQFTGGGNAGTQTVEYGHYNVTATDLNNCWRGGVWGDVLSDFQKLRELTQDKSPRYAGIAKICQAFMFSIAVDAWGDIPFTEALQFDKNVRPKFDKSSDIYTALFTLIDSGLADLAATSQLFPTTDDLIYGGSVTLWTKFANTLKLRMLIKYYPTNTTFANTQIAALLASGVPFMAANADQFQMGFDVLTNRTNAIDQFERQRANQFWPTTTLVDMMNLSNDPRRPFFFSLAAGVYSGMAPGIIITNPATSRHHVYLRGAVSTGGPTGYAGDAPQRMLTFAEHNFNLAEYYLRSGQLALAQTAFTNGITANMNDATVAAANRNIYLTTNATLSGTFATALQQIITEKYIANFGVAVQPWSDWRRTGFPVLAPAIGAVLPNIPRILPYSDIERTTNPDNTPVRETTDLVKSNVFWDPGA